MTNPNVLLTVGGPVDLVTISVAIYGKDLEPAAITALVGVEPTSSHRRGDREGPRSPPHRTGAWLLSTRCEPPEDPDSTVAQLLGNLPDDEELWARLAQTYDLRLWLCIGFSGWNKGFELSPATVRRVARMGFRIALDLYASEEGAR